jgi:hypothetical protein
MKAKIDVRDRNEARAIRRGLADPETRALVAVMGVLTALPSDRARRRALWCAKDFLDEQRQEKKATP